MTRTPGPQPYDTAAIKALVFVVLLFLVAWPVLFGLSVLHKTIDDGAAWLATATAAIPVVFLLSTRRVCERRDVVLVGSAFVVGTCTVGFPLVNETLIALMR